ncbi:MAG: epoxyqueuosine reductase QueH [Clostridiales bacterium]|jgi:predicted adenine nucleotide alpha hydrolase (AANH) superfamily ATPase|nr:epoxyqueuosine reductase QueH [Clostridiales bacterium]
MRSENYDTIMEDILRARTESRLLLHCCCAPCASAAAERLLQAEILPTLFFYNPNITDPAEYDRRAEALKKLAALYRLPAVFRPFDPAAFEAAAKGREAQPEGGSRCEACFLLRLGGAAEYAAQNGYGLFATTLTVSPHKNAAQINRIGLSLSGRYPGTAYLPTDFKKRDGYLRSIRLSGELSLYRQDYCGCGFSKRERAL